MGNIKSTPHFSEGFCRYFEKKVKVHQERFDEPEIPDMEPTCDSWFELECNVKCLSHPNNKDWAEENYLEL